MRRCATYGSHSYSAAIVAGACLQRRARLEQRHHPQPPSRPPATPARAPRARRTAARSSRSRTPARPAARTPSADSATVSSTRSSSPSSPPGSCSIPRRSDTSASVSSADPAPLVGVRVARQQRGDRRAHDARALADVDPGEVEAEHVDLPQQPPDRAQRDVARAQVREHELEVAPQRLRVRVARLAPARAAACWSAGARRTRASCAAAPTRGAAGAARRRSAAPRRRPASDSSSSTDTGIRSDECENARASRSTRSRSSRSAVTRCSCSAPASVSAPTSGCPSMSPPVQDP